MATLSGNQIKDTYPSLLKLESNGATATPKTVEDGAGVDTALALSTDTVQVDALSFSTLPATSATEATALFVDGSNNVVKRELNDVAFTGTVQVAPEVVVGVMESDLPLTGSYQTLGYAVVDNLNETQSYHMGYLPASFAFTPVSGTVENRNGADVVTRVSASATVDVTASNSIIQYKLQRFTGGAWVDVKEVIRSKSSTGVQIDSFWGMFVLAPTEQIRVQMLVSSGAAVVKAGTVIEFREETVGNI
jgi:hypothetical protein